MQRFLLVLVLGWLTGTGFAATAIPAPPALDATAWLLMDFHTGKILAEHDADAPVPPASITKIMTSYVVYHELAKNTFTLETTVKVSERAWRMKGSKMFIEVGDEVSVQDLLRGVVIQSGNDASVALAELVAGSEETFADYMNIHADRLGMKGTTYRNSTGWPHEEHLTTARDIALLSRALIHEFPEHYAMYAQKEFSYNGIDQYNRNKLLWSDDSVDGIKTGHTREAGYCLVSSADRDGMRLIAVVLGTGTEKARAEASRRLLGYGYRFYQTHRLYAAGETLSQTRVWGGAQEQLPLGLDKDLFVTIPRGRYKELAAAMQIDDEIAAPVARHQAIGRLRVTLQDQLVAEQPLLAIQGVADGNLWQQARDAVLKLFQ